MDGAQDYAITIPLPAGVVPQHSVAVVAFFDGEGETRYAFRLEGEASLSSVLGLLEIVKQHVIREAAEW